VEGLEGGADDYLLKPFSARELIARVRSNLELSRLRREAEREAREMNAILERRVEARTVELEDLVKELETFAYSVAHDLRAPLRAMHGFSQILLEDEADRLSADGRNAARRIAEAGKRMDLLITGLLAYSRVSRQEIPIGCVELGAIVQAALEHVSREVEEQKAEIVVETPLPPARGHAITLTQAVANLLSNAVKFVAPEVTPRVRVRAEDREPWVRLWIEDNGIGIPPAYQSQIFRLFERLHGPEGSYPGTGIGLAITRRALERMGGRVGLEPSAVGSRFWIELPSATTETRSDPHR
jgi:signal transduction histidine kinase